MLLLHNPTERTLHRDSQLIKRRHVTESGPGQFPQLPPFRAAAYALRRNLLSAACFANAVAWGVGLGSVHAVLERTHATPAFWGTLLFSFSITYLSTTPWRVRVVPRKSLKERTRFAEQPGAGGRIAWDVLIWNGLLATITGFAILLCCLGLPVAVKYNVSPIVLLRIMSGSQLLTVLTGALCFPVVGYAMVMWQERKRDQKRLAQQVQRMEQLADEAHLVALRAQINPHFFFNALNTIAALIPSRPTDAERAVELLASALRPVLMGTDSSNGERELAWVVPLNSEVEVAQAYAELERLRFGGRLSVSFSIDPTTGSRLLPALSLQPLVENAIRYGAPPTGENYLVHVATYPCSDGDPAGNDSFCVEICNAPHSLIETGTDDMGTDKLADVIEQLPDLEPAALRRGHALANIHARVQALSGRKARLEVLVSPGRRAALARLIIPVLPPVQHVGSKSASNYVQSLASRL